MPRLQSFGAATILLAAVLALPLPTPEASSADAPPDSTEPLHRLMVGLAQDMDRIATGIWHEDYTLIREGAYGIAQHPKIPPRQIAKIKKALGPSFKTFVQYDKTVHREAMNLVQAAEARTWSSVLQTRARLQQGCVNCHTAFRDSLRTVLSR
jgi:cytochrome c556